MGQLSVDLSTRVGELKHGKRPLPTAQRIGITFPKYFTQKLEPGRTPYDELKWEPRTASIGNDKGATIFEQRDIEVPADWSQTATNIVVSKYFYGKIGSPERESSVRQLISRVVDTIADWGVSQRYFKTVQDAANFRDDLAHLMLTQKACFNSPVWFNVGVKEPRGYGWYYDESTVTIKKLKDGESAPAMLGLLHQFGGRHAGIDSGPGQDRGHAVQVGVGNGHQFVHPARRRMDCSPAADASGPLELHEGLRRLRRRHQERREDSPRRQDGDPQRGPSRHREVHPLQEKEEKKAHTLIDAGYDSSHRRRCLQLHLLPERQQLRARHRRVHGSRGWRSRLVDRSWPAVKPVTRYKARDLHARHRRGNLAVRRPGHAVRYHGEPLAHIESHRAHQCVQSVLGIHVPGRFGLQSGIAESDEVRGTGRRVRRGGFPACRAIR
jgi:hypothetical protein